jgi:hypothetical protein
VILEQIATDSQNQSIASFLILESLPDCIIPAGLANFTFYKFSSHFHIPDFLKVKFKNNPDFLKVNLYLGLKRQQRRNRLQH